MMGFVVLTGLFEPGTVVELFPAESNALRVGSETAIGRRVADASGSVGFDGLDVGARFLARGRDVYSNPIEERCRGLAEDEGTELGQPPIRPVPQVMGTSETREPEESVGEPDAILQVGVPAGLPLGLTTS